MRIWRYSNSQILLRGRSNPTNCFGKDIGSFWQFYMIQSFHSYIFTQEKWKLMSTQRVYVNMFTSFLFHIQMLNNNWINKHAVVFPYSGTCSEIKMNHRYMKQHDGSHNKYYEWTETHTREPMIYNSLYIKVWKMQINLWWQEAAQRRLGSGGEGWTEVGEKNWKRVQRNFGRWMIHSLYWLEWRFHDYMCIFKTYSVVSFKYTQCVEFQLYFNIGWQSCMYIYPCIFGRQCVWEIPKWKCIS